MRPAARRPRIAPAPRCARRAQPNPRRAHARTGTPCHAPRCPERLHDCRYTCRWQGTVIVITEAVAMHTTRDFQMNYAEGARDAVGCASWAGRWLVARCGRGGRGSCTHLDACLLAPPTAAPRQTAPLCAGKSATDYGDTMQRLKLLLADARSRYSRQHAAAAAATSPSTAAAAASPSRGSGDVR